jgi:hypothetical protein
LALGEPVEPVELLRFLELMAETEEAHLSVVLLLYLAELQEEPEASQKLLK